MDTFEVHHLTNIGQLITDTIDFEESANVHRVVVKNNVDPRLDKMRRTYAGMGDMLSEVAREITASAALPGNVANALNVIYFPQIGYLVVVPSVPRTPSGVATESTENEEVQPAFVGEDWEFQFSTATSWYYKSPEMRQMDEYFGDLYGLIGGRFWTFHLLKLQADDNRLRPRDRDYPRTTGPSSRARKAPDGLRPGVF
jgi:DNA mismatch repair protein MSH5